MTGSLEKELRSYFEKKVAFLNLNRMDLKKIELNLMKIIFFKKNVRKELVDLNLIDFKKKNSIQNS